MKTMLGLLLLLTITGCATTETFCQKVERAGKKWDRDLLDEAITDKLKEGKNLNTLDEKTAFIKAELRGCGYSNLD